MQAIILIVVGGTGVLEVVSDPGARIPHPLVMLHAGIDQIHIGIIIVCEQ
jgi:hypothetical protein